jgi:hypothetical protein
MPMRPNAILHEIQQLYNVSDRLDSLAEQHPSSQKHSSPSREAFVTRQPLEVLVATKIAPIPGLDPASA